MTIEFTNQLIFGGALLALLSVFASVLSRRLGAPLLLVFLVLGMLAGEDGPGGIKFNDFGLAFLMGNLALAIIIFDGGLGTRKDSLRVCLSPSLALATVGVLVTAGLTGLAAWWALRLPWQESLLIGAIVGSTDAAAVFGLLRAAGLELKERTGATLEIESSTNDPMAIFLTLALVQLLVSGSDNAGWAVLTEFLRQMGLGLLLGGAGGYILTALFKRLTLSASLYPLMALTGALSVFGVTALSGGSGFLAIYIVGFMIGNAALPYGRDIRRFHDGMAWMSQIGMFLMLGLLIDPSSLLAVAVPATIIALMLIFVARPAAVVLSLLPFRFPWREQVFISWCGLRGAVPIILALFPSLAGLEHSSTYFELAFFVVLISLVLQGWTIAPVARWLGVEVPPAPQEPAHLSLRIPDDHEKELLVYQTVAGSGAAGMAVSALPLAQGAQLLGVLRHGVVIDPMPVPILAPQDQVLVLATADSTAALGRLFSPAHAPAQLEAAAFFGMFVINPDACLIDLSQVYGFAVEPKFRQMTVAEYFAKTFHGRPVVGDRVRLGSVQFVLKDIEGDRITAVRLKLG